MDGWGTMDKGPMDGWGTMDGWEQQIGDQCMDGGSWMDGNNG